MHLVKKAMIPQQLARRNFVKWLLNNCLTLQGWVTQVQLLCLHAYIYSILVWKKWCVVLADYLLNKGAHTCSMSECCQCKGLASGLASFCHANCKIMLLVVCCSLYVWMHFIVCCCRHGQMSPVKDVHSIKHAFCGRCASCRTTWLSKWWWSWTQTWTAPWTSWSTVAL